MSLSSRLATGQQQCQWFVAPPGEDANRNKPKRLKIRYVNQIQGFEAKQTQRSYLTCCQLDTAQIRPFCDENKCPSSSRIAAILRAVNWIQLESGPFATKINATHPSRISRPRNSQRRETVKGEKRNHRPVGGRSQGVLSRKGTAEAAERGY